MDIKEYRKLIDEIEESQVDVLEDVDPGFKFEYAYEYLTERKSLYKKRISHA